MPDGQHKQATSAQRQTLPISHVRTESALPSTPDLGETSEHVCFVPLTEVANLYARGIRHGIIKAGFAAWTFVRGAPRRAVKPARPRPSRSALSRPGGGRVATGSQARLTGGRSRPNREPIKAALRRYVVNHTSSHFWIREKWVRCLKLLIVMSVTVAWGGHTLFCARVAQARRDL